MEFLIINPVLEGISVRGIEIRMINSLPEFIRENQVEIAILTLPKNKAKEMAKVLIDNGIKAIWNFAHTDLGVSGDIIVENGAVCCIDTGFDVFP